MANWVRWSSEEGNAPEGVRELLRAAGAPAPMPAASHARALSFATDLASGKTVGALSIASSKVLAGGLVVGTACAVAALAVGHRGPTATVLSPAASEDARGALTQIAPSQQQTTTPPRTHRSRSAAVADTPAPLPKTAAGDDLRDEPDPGPQPTRDVQAKRGMSPRPQTQAGETSKPTDSAQTLAEEAALLERARHALATDPALALRLTEAHTARFPRGQLLSASQVVAIEALRRLGREDEARARARRLVGTEPDGLYSDRVRKLVPTE